MLQMLLPEETDIDLLDPLRLEAPMQSLYPLHPTAIVSDHLTSKKKERLFPHGRGSSLSQLSLFGFFLGDTLREDGGVRVLI
jgi:hypothetical protein